MEFSVGEFAAQFVMLARPRQSAAGLRPNFGTKFRLIRCPHQMRDAT